MSEQNHRRMTVERLNAATAEEKAELTRGYADGRDGAPIPDDMVSDFYDHGRDNSSGG